MEREAQLAAVRQQVSVLAEQVVCLVDVISRQADAGSDTGDARNKLDILEHLMWRLHARQSRLKNQLH